MTSKSRFYILFSVLLFLAGYSVAVTVFLSGRYKFIPATSAYAEENENSSIYAPAEKVQEAFRRISAQVLPSVVEVTVKTEGIVENNENKEIPWNEFFVNPDKENPPPKYFQSHGLGSGVILKKKSDLYYAVTNLHVIGSTDNLPEKDIKVKIFNGEVFPAELSGFDSRKDIAVLEFKIDDPQINLPAVQIGDSDKLYTGDWVLAFGSPYGYDQSVSSGIVSALGRTDGPGDNINDFIQTDASINQGNSGGALVNIHGELIGINTFITTPNSGSIGLGFAIPVNNIKNTVEQIIQNGKIQYGWLGVSLGYFSGEYAHSLDYKPGSGIMVYQVFKDSPAFRAGIRPGDLITELNGKNYTNSDKLIYHIGDIPPGDTAELRINRFGKDFTVKVKLTERKKESELNKDHFLAWPGFVPAPLLDDFKKQLNLPMDTSGVVVAEVYPKTYANSVDLRPGDVIVKVNNINVDSLKSLYLILGESFSPVFTVIRNTETFELTNTLPEL